MARSRKPAATDTTPAVVKRGRVTADALKAARKDGWSSTMTGAGQRGIDKTGSYAFQSRAPMTPSECRDMYRQNWIAGRIVDDIVTDATRSGFDAVCDENPDLPAKLHEAWKASGIVGTISDSLRWALVFGGSVGLLLTDDTPLSTSGSLLAQKLDTASLRSIKRIMVVDRRYALPDLTLLTDEPTSPNFGLPEFYQVTPFGKASNLSTYKVHWSRLLRVDGVPCDMETRVANLTWGDSLLERAYDTLRRYGMAFEGVAVLCAEFGSGVLAMNQLAQMLGGDQDEKILKRVAMFKQMLSQFGIALIDADNEKYERLNVPVSGLDKLLDLVKQDVAGAFHRPQSGIWGNATGTLAGATEDTKAWASFVHGWQMLAVVPALRRFTELLLASKDGPTRGKVPAKWDIVPKQIDPPDLDKEIERRLKQAQIDKIEYEMDALEGSEIRTSRHGGAAYSHETTLDPKITAAKAKAATEREPALPDGGDDDPEA